MPFQQREKLLLGVCAWLADRYNLDVGGLRLVFLLGVLFSAGTVILLYLILFLIKPK